MKKYFDKTLLIYMALGLVNFLVCTGAMLLVYNYGNTSQEIAFLVYYSLSSTVSLILNRFVTFRDQHPGVSWPWKFILCVIVCYILTKVFFKDVLDLVLLSPSVQFRLQRLLPNADIVHLENNISLVSSSLAYCILNYFGQRYFVFRAHRLKKRRASPGFAGNARRAFSFFYASSGPNRITAYQKISPGSGGNGMPERSARALTTTP